MRISATVLTVLTFVVLTTGHVSAVTRDSLTRCSKSSDTRSTCPRHGDVNADGMVSASDAQWAFLFALGLEIPSVDQLCFADCSGDSEITAGDAQGIFGTVLGVNQCFDLLPPTNMVLIPAGSYDMGSEELPIPELCRADDEIQHAVTLTHDFWMLPTEVTQWQWEAVFGDGSNPSFYRGAYRPVEQVTFYDVLIYCNRLSFRDGLTPCYYDDPELTRIYDGIPPVTSGTVYWDVTANGYRLPSEAEWEYACRGTTSTPFNNGLVNTDCEVDSVLDDIAWYEFTAESFTQGVAMKNSNSFGLFDMHGNVWEWAWDRYGSYATDSVTNPTGPDIGTDRIVRGGSACDSVAECRSAKRESTNPGYAFY